MIRKNFLVAGIAAVAINEVAANRLTTTSSADSSSSQGHGQCEFDHHSYWEGVAFPKLNKQMREYEPPMFGLKCNGGYLAGHIYDWYKHKRQWFVFANTCPNTVFIMSVWMKTADWGRVLPIPEAQGQEATCFPSYWHPD